MRVFVVVRTHFMQTIISSEPFIKCLPPPTAPPLSSFFPYLLFLLRLYSCCPSDHHVRSTFSAILFYVRSSLAWPWGANKSSLSRPRMRELVEAEGRAAFGWLCDAGVGGGHVKRDGNVSCGLARSAKLARFALRWTQD